MNVLPSFRTALRARVSYLPRSWYSTTPTANPSAGSSAPSASSSSALPSSSATEATANASRTSARLNQLEAEISAASAKPSARGRPATSSYRPSEFTGSTTFPTSTQSARSATRAAPPSADDNWRYASVVSYSSPVTTTTARSFAVKNNDVAKAYRSLNRVLMENNVRKELRRQERFESGSDKRVRLNSERHRRRFKVAVGKAVSMAMRMKDM